MSLLQNSNAISEGVAAFTGDTLRFNATNTTYLSRTQSTPTDGRKWTLSFWVKRGVTGNDQTIISAGTAFSFYMEIGFETTDTVYVPDQIYIRARDETYFFNTVASFDSWIYAFRDPTAWYHIVISVDTTASTESNRMSVYVNNKVLVGQNPPQVLYQNIVLPIGAAGTYNIGRRSYNGTKYYDGNLTQFYFIDGQTLTPSSFAETDIATGQWIPKVYSGTYGNNGFHLSFTVGTSVIALGADQSGNNNNWTLNNFTRSVGINDCWIKDYPANSATSTQPKSNYCIVNDADLNTTATLINGNSQSTAAAFQNGVGSIYVDSGKWYWECQFTGGTSGLLVGVFNGTTSTTATVALTTNVIGVRFDRDVGTLEYSIDGINWTSIATGLTSGKYAPFIGSANFIKTFYINFGQRQFQYTVPTNYKTLCTSNLPLPAVTTPYDYFGIVKWFGNDASSRGITGLNFRPDFVWGKPNATSTHWLYDVVRGPGLSFAIATNSSSGTNNLGESFGGLTAFNNFGFTVTTGSTNNNLVNSSSINYYISWNWKGSNTTAFNIDGFYNSTVSPNNNSGFTVFKYTATTNSSATVGHGLNIAPKFLMIKNLSQTSDWAVWHTSIGTNTLSINNPYAETANSAFFNNSAPNSSVIPLGYSPSDPATNNAGNDFVGYAFAEVEGFSRIGSFTGNGNADGPFVYCGFRPRYILIKNASIFATWLTYDTTMNAFNPMLYTFTPSANFFEQSSVFKTIDFLANGFKITGANNDINGNGNKIVYMALANNPFNTSTAL